MSKLAIASCLALAAALSIVPLAGAETVVSDYEDLTEGGQGDPFTYQGVTYHDLNTVSGVFPDGSTFDPQPDDQFIIENAGVFYIDFPAYGSPVNALTFGIAWVPGENLTMGPLSTVTLDLDQPATEASLDLAYYENGPWGGIVFHFDALSQGQVVASDSFDISNLGGRDNPAIRTLAVSAGEITQLKLYATFGEEYSMPRAMIDDLTITYGGLSLIHI
ncbi:MAG: hypothetical protein QUU85_12735 [Candidatus Eisenbacteria bacterium]|nr:hypothetical protein [Candidatus Eisenbacteria bacterium]